MVVSEKGWIRALRGTATDLSSIAFKADDGPKFAFPAETTSRCLVFASNGRFYTLDAAKLPGGRGHGEPIRLFIDLEQEADVVAAFRHQGGRKFLLASAQGRGFVVPEDECLANTRKGKQVLNVTPPDAARAIAVVEGELVASIGENRKMVIFPLDQVPDMTRGRGVRLQRYKDGGLCDLKTFKAEEGLSWTDAAGRAFSLTLKELADWRGNRADAGRHRLKRRPSRQTSVVRPSRADAEDAVRTLIRWAGDDPDREGLVGTPARVARAYEEWFAGYFEDPREYLKRTFEEVAGYDEIVLLRDIRFESHCEHHMAPIIGRVHVGYLPRQRIVGISKLVRLVDVYSKRLQVQEKMTAEIAACLDSVLKPFGVGVVVEAAHECMTTRGVHKSDVTMVTSCMLGTFRTKAATRQEFLSAINLKGGAPSGNAIR